MTQVGAIYRDTQNGGVTNGREVGAYAVAQATKLAAVFAVGHLGILSPIYGWALHNGGGLVLFAVSTGLATGWTALGAVVFFVLRVAFGGVPASVSRDRGAAISGAEIGAFAFAYLIDYIVVSAVNWVLLASFYGSLPPATRVVTVMVVSMGVSVVSAIVVFLIFIGLRRAFAGR